MNASLRRTKRRPWLAAVFLLAGAIGCNELIGASDPTAREADSSAACVLNSDCAAQEICIFRVCSPPCHTDGDCLSGFRCLQTQAGTACVGNAAAVCVADESCPSGAECRAGSCRNGCQSAGSCLAPQQCLGGVCVGPDPSHDPGVDGGGDASADASVEASGPDASNDAPADLTVDQNADRTVADDAADVLARDAPPEGAQDSPEEATGAPPDAAPDAADAQAEAGCGGTATDVHNCGACSHDCSLLSNVSAPGLMCSAGHCVYQCASGHADCADAGAGCETDLTTSPNCGACGVTCGGGTPLCAPSSSPGGFACASGCPMGAPTLCSNTCVDTTTSAANCGKCGMACTTTVAHAVAECVASGCTTACATGYSSCGGACVDETSDDNNCNACGAKCTGGAHCVSSSCQCTGGTHLCAGSCVANDVNACGSTCTMCTAPTGGTVSCDGTNCSQACSVGGQTVCSNVCVDKTTNTSNCGTCGMACTGTTPDCVNGTCVECTSGVQCAAGNTPQTCTGNQWVSQTPCSGASPVCYNGGCVACTSGTQCDSTNTMVQTCSGDQWVTLAMCSSSEICRSAMCVNAVHDAGWDTPLASSFGLSANVLYTFKLPTLAHDAKLLAFGAYGDSAPDAAVTAARMAIYPDNGSGTAPSGMPIGYVASPNYLGLTNGAVEQTASLNGTGTLSANTVYWIGIIVSAATTIYSGTDSAGLGNGYPLSYPSFPTTLSGSTGTMLNGIDLAIYINVQDLN